MNKPILNCDIGESFGAWKMGNDSDVMPYIDCANIACGFHAADPSTIRKTVQLALSHNVCIGAHPSYPDLVGFGRRSMVCSSDEIVDLLHYQLGALSGICNAHGGEIKYVKPHGALYTDMIRDETLLRAVFKAVSSFQSKLPLMLMSRVDNSVASKLSEEFDVPVWFEVFADRAYDCLGNLVSRSVPGAVHHDVGTIIEQAVKLASGVCITSMLGTNLTLRADTICVHGDNEESILAILRIREALRRESVK
ncbi:5-oxoprolinase subunit PxpA [Pseudomonas sp.]|uniref:5-oxoprolinase subunit PxpA n=1 Tax=Pseudomonas sp. TaxID=306 RepID=UPI0024896BF4|nr:5-oxoprolinase subunit PxpA [Pseudomonas sp.]MDI1332505.1 LamB/YcsF family protein [Pseudomonas sp.]